jgi:hypothetical protein
VSGPSAQSYRVLGLAIVGTVLIISGGGMPAYVVWSKSRPEAL